MKIFAVFILATISLAYATPLSIEWTEKDLQSLNEPFSGKFSTVDDEVLQDAHLTTLGLLEKYGYPAEAYHVKTEDGYILEMHRIPKPGGIPVYLQHGLMDSSGGWVIMGPKHAFAYRLADLGYDVWMGNIRGNRYSKNHTTLNIKDGKFWDFSFHELGVYDAPAMIDFIIKNTGFQKIHYVGHSQGTTMFWVMCAERPEYCDKVLAMQAMAPIAFLSHVRSPIIRFTAPFVGSIEMMTKYFGQFEFLPNTEFFKVAGEFFCNQMAITQDICTNAIFLVTGYNSEQLNTTMLPAILGHVPAGSSVKQFIHFGQLVQSGRFRKYDYGTSKNKELYGAYKPTSYDLSKVTAPVALHFSMNDWLAHEKDVKKLQNQLPNVIKKYEVPSPKFNHLDFLIAINSRELVQNEVIKMMKIVESKMNMD